MKKTVSSILMVLVVLSLPASSLLFGIGGGRTYNSIIAGDNYRAYSYPGSFEWKTGLPVTVECTSHFGFETGLSLTGKAYFVEREASGVKTTDIEERNVFLTVPLSLRVSLKWVDNVSIFFSLGGYAGWYLGGARSGSVLSLDSAPVSVSDSVDMVYRSRYAYGVTASLGYTADISNLRFSLSLGYSLDLSDMHREQTFHSYPIHNSTFDISAGLQWRVR